MIELMTASVLQVNALRSLESAELGDKKTVICRIQDPSDGRDNVVPVNHC